jgi:CRISPR/Cas system-associated exonuclease Cas4 (RecB family)
MSIINLTTIFHNHVASERRKWAHDRTTTVGASEVFGCMRKTWFEKKGQEQGYEPDPDYIESWGATERGNIIENHFLVPAFRNQLPPGLKVSFEGDEQQTIVQGKSSATPDSVVSGFPPGKPLVVETDEKRIVIPKPAANVVFEFKSIHPGVKLVGAKEVHIGQAIVQMGLLRDVMGVDVKDAIILYVNASHLDDIDFYHVEFDEKRYQHAKKRAAEVFEVKDPNDIRPEGKLTGDCKWCPWKMACGEAIVHGIPDDKGMIGHNSQHFSEFEKAVENYKHWKEVADEADREKKYAQEAVKDLLLDSGLNSAKSDHWSISWSKVSGRKTLDKKAMVADGIDVSKYEKEGAPYDRLMIKTEE